MGFEVEHDVAVADPWLRPPGARRPWGEVCRLGPEGHDARLRVALLDPDDTRDGRPVLVGLLPLLAAHTRTPDDVVAAQWDGNNGRGGSTWSAGSGWAEVVSPLPDEVLDAPRAVLRDEAGHPARSYWLLRGRLADLAGPVPWPAREPHRPPSFPEVVCGALWPADRAWWWTWDVDDDHAATLVCSEPLAAAVLARDDLEVERA